MTTFKEMPLDTTLQKGDIVTITGPGEHDVLVREVTGPNAGKAGLMYFTDGVVKSVLGRKNRTLTRIQRPVPALPTVEGTHILRLSDGASYVRTLAGGDWFGQRGLKVHKAGLMEHVEAGATLTRVIPADDARHPEVDVKAAMDALKKEWMTSRRDSYELDFESVLRRVLEGEFDL